MSYDRKQTRAFRKELTDLFNQLQNVESDIYDLLNAARTTSLSDEVNIIEQIVRTYVRTWAMRHAVNTLMREHTRQETPVLAESSQDYI